MYGLSSDLAHAVQADRRREAARVALENTVSVRPRGESLAERRLGRGLSAVLELGRCRPSRRSTAAAG